MTTEKDFAEESATLGALLRAPFEALITHNYSRLAGDGFPDIRVTHGAVFRNITKSGSRITDLARRARMTKQSMGELVEYLRERGYVELAPDPHDGRAKLVRLTGRGMAVIDALIAHSREFEQTCAARLGEANWARFRKILAELGHTARELFDRSDPDQAADGKTTRSSAIRSAGIPAAD